MVVDSIQINAPLITISKGTPVKLAGGTGVYSLQFKGTGGNATNNDKYLTGTSGTYAEAASVYVPSTQFYVKENEDGTYSAQVRDKRSIDLDRVYYQLCTTIETLVTYKISNS